MTMVQILPNVWWGPYPSHQPTDNQVRWRAFIDGVVEVLKELDPHVERDMWLQKEGVGHNQWGEAYIKVDPEYILLACVLERPAHFVLFVAGMDEDEGDLESIQDELEYTPALQVEGDNKHVYHFYPEVVAHPGYLPGGERVLFLTVSGGKREVSDE